MSTPLPQPDAYEYLIANVWRAETHFNGVKAKEHRCLYATEKMHAHAAAVSAERDAEIAQLRADAIDRQNNVVMPLRRRIKVLEDALQRYVNYDLLTGTRGKMNEIARAALGDKNG